MKAGDLIKISSPPGGLQSPWNGVLTLILKEIPPPSGYHDGRWYAINLKGKVLRMHEDWVELVQAG